ncbi:FCSD flavin-binding domain-containing protein [Noviherbaspirillum galbum]|uniref:FAD-dependent oxidoreductase n=1 Tax=Noviherbaspirillum galbum TaxID=2709383 RepID=A0A6B3SQB4_9BURK|nr:NAD(P)/FAD-dependent oxidoreductase [Noviherbaspirillum galbum]NEX63100.1 FAD-dependent oxidoreductase [Noviherbaspirillum galbum]
MKRRAFLKTAGASATWALAGCASIGNCARPQVVVVGGGFGGATAAKYLRLWSEGGIDVTLVEPNPRFVSCPLSNLVLGGHRTLDDLTLDYDALPRRYGVRLVHASVAEVRHDRREAALSDGTVLRYDRIVLSPGVEFMFDALPALSSPAARNQVVHAWKAGPQTLALRRQLEAMPDGGVFVMTVPPQPYRCPPGPYERACQVATYFQRAKPRSKVLILDANDDVVSKGALFKRIWAERYPGMIEYQPQFRLADADLPNAAVISELGDRVRADVLNLIPPQRAGDIALQAGVANANGRWCHVDFRSFESTRMPGVHVLGDAIQVAPLMPKSGHMANQHAKVCAGAIVAAFEGHEMAGSPVINNTCYSFVTGKEAIHVASVHAYDAAARSLIVVPGSGGLSPGASELEGRYAGDWARNIWSDMLA